MSQMESRIPGFYRLAPDARLAEVVARVPGLEAGAFTTGGLGLPTASAMIENVIGLFALPNAVAVNLLLDGRDRLVPMVVEEPSVVAAVSNMARLSRTAGGVRSDADPSVMIGQVHVARPTPGAADRIRAALPRLQALAAEVHPQLARFGGGLRGMEVRELRYDEPGEEPEDMVVLHFLLDCADAMGANMVNTIAERLSPEVVALAGGRTGLRILSNLADRRLARAWVTLPFSALDDEDLPGQEVAEAVAAAWRFAWADPYRAATHNKGIMNGVDAVALATGNDWRAIEAGAHAFAARDGRYRPLSSWRIRDGTLVGHLELPLQVGTVGGPIRVHPTVQANHAIAGITGASDLARLMAAVGLVQNLGALRALATEGIQEGHMRMHARTVALQAGAQGDEVAPVVEALCVTAEFTVERARAVLGERRGR
jgi:hydroxymethylglutaryl-CoA reductase